MKLQLTNALKEGSNAADRRLHDAIKDNISTMVKIRPLQMQLEMSPHNGTIIKSFDDFPYSYNVDDQNSSNSLKILNGYVEQRVTIIAEYGI